MFITIHSLQLPKGMHFNSILRPNIHFGPRIRRAACSKKVSSIYFPINETRRAPRKTNYTTRLRRYTILPLAISNGISQRLRALHSSRSLRFSKHPLEQRFFHALLLSSKCSRKSRYCIQTYPSPISIMITAAFQNSAKFSA